MCVCVCVCVWRECWIVYGGFGGEGCLCSLLCEKSPWQVDTSNKEHGSLFVSVGVCMCGLCLCLLYVYDSFIVDHFDFVRPGQRYCPLLQEEGGVEKIHQLMAAYSPDSLHYQISANILQLLKEPVVHSQWTILVIWYTECVVWAVGYCGQCSERLLLFWELQELDRCSKGFCILSPGFFSVGFLSFCPTFLMWLFTYLPYPTEHAFLSPGWRALMFIHKGQVAFCV